MAKKKVVQETVYKIPIFIRADFFEALGVDTSIKHSEEYYLKKLKVIKSKKNKIKYSQTLDDEKSKKRDDALAKEGWEILSDSEKESFRKEVFGGGDAQYDYIVNNYPPQTQKIAKLYFEVFQIEPNNIPSQHGNKSNFGYWVKELDEISRICGIYSVDGLVRAKRNYDTRHDFEIDHPGTIFKILKSALEEIEMEREILFVPDKGKKITSKTSLTQMRDSIG